ncbi:prevent-host-death protein [candidate division KSB1 bacterium]|nr:prevent-host-death protein [candidate division KSB1 bacterium]
MPINRPVHDLMKKTQEILELCKRENQPIFLKDNGHDELVIMSRDYFNRLWNLLASFEEEKWQGKSLANQSFHFSSLEELDLKLNEAKIAIDSGAIYPHEEVMARLKDRLNARKIDSI